MSAYFYDGGANVGQTFDWHLLKGSYARHHVVCFEPSPRNLTALAARCAALRDRFASVTLVAAALGRPGLRRLYEGPTPMGDSLVPGRLQAPPSIEVATISLAEYLRAHTVPGDTVEIKLDVEGAEAEVLADLLAGGLDGRVRRVLVEWHGAPPERAALEAGFAAAGVPLERWAF